MQLSNATHFHAFLVVNANLGANISLERNGFAPKIAPLSENIFELGSQHVTFVVEAEDQKSTLQGTDYVGEGRTGVPARVERALSLATVDSFVRDAVAFGAVIANESFPDVIVSEITVLIVGWIEVDQIGLNFGSQS